MKKLFGFTLIFTILLSLFSCKEPNTVTHDGIFIRSANKFQFEGHDYILFIRSTEMNGIVHDPNCPCWKFSGYVPMDYPGKVYEEEE